MIWPKRARCYWHNMLLLLTQSIKAPLPANQTSWKTLIPWTYNVAFTTKTQSYTRNMIPMDIQWKTASQKRPCFRVSLSFVLKWERKINMFRYKLNETLCAACILFLLLYLVDSSSQSDTNSTEATKSTDGRLGTKLTDSPRSDRDRASGSPDGESPKGFGQEKWVVCYVAVYWYHTQQFIKLPLARISWCLFTQVEGKKQCPS